MSSLDDFMKTIGAQKTPEEPPAPALDPAVVAGVMRRAMEWVRSCGTRESPGQVHLLFDLDALAREAEESVARRAPIDLGPFRGRERALPTWWRDEYTNDPLLHALAARGMVASQALPHVIAAYWCARGMVMGLAMQAPPPRFVLPSPDPALTAKLAALEVEAQRLRGAVREVVQVARPIRAIDGSWGAIDRSWAPRRGDRETGSACGGTRGPDYVVPEALMVALVDAVNGGAKKEGGA